MKKFLLNLLLIIAPMGLLVVLTNYFIDPANVFTGEQYVSGMSDILVKGHNLDNVANYDERALQEQMVRKLPYKPDVVVLGSSRIMELGGDFFPGKKVLNCGVSHGNINDLMAITGLLDSMGKLPEEMVINLDPHLVSLGGTSEWQTLYPYYSSFVHTIHFPDVNPGQPLILKKLINLFSFEYFERSLAFVAGHKSKHYRDVGSERPVVYGRFSDGTICYPASYAYPDTLKIAADARAVGNREMTTLDPERIRQLDALLDFLAARKIKVILVMLPYHLQYYHMMNRRFNDMFQSYDKLFRNIAAKRNIPVEGGFDAARLGIPENEFYDSYHCSKEAIKKIFNNQ
ncbi:MAG TPA: hypothetical protein VGS79_04330 [Puia sp.]|nr:hypothetical protein [Puia sp.]